MVERVHNFSAGPGTLPLPVLEEAQRDLLALPGVGISVLEISHRSPPFLEIVEEAKSNLKALLGLPEGYRVLFLQGGASQQFSTVPMNFLRGRSEAADYVVTGSWGSKAVKEARREGAVNVAWDGEADGYTRVPAQDELTLTPGAAYVHVTSNETIQGVQFPDDLDAGDVPLICDMSSDFLSRPIQADRYALIYAGAQKNAGPAGVTVVIVREDLLEKIPTGLHTMLDYRTHAQKDSAYNTPPVFAVYVVNLVTRWLLDEVGGLEQVQARNAQKAKLLYDAIDGSEGFYRGHVRPESRSAMNVTWRLPSEDLEARFLEEAQAEGLVQLKGHRSVGGLRASIYNAMPRESVEVLRDFMRQFQHKHG